RPLRLGDIVVIRRDQALAGRLRGYGVEDWIVREERVVGEIHLGYQPRHPRWAEQREMYVRGPPGVGVVLPGVGTGADCEEAIYSLRVRDAAADPEEVGVERAGPLIAPVDVAPGGVGLPHLHQGVGHG